LIRSSGGRPDPRDRRGGRYGIEAPSQWGRRRGGRRREAQAEGIADADRDEATEEQDDERRH
jgi:hypothetical protein